MITLLRKIRQRLIRENRITSYSLYALGEIALVVIGILIALQINNWNENRKAKLTEQKYLLGLKEEFQANLGELDRFIKDNKGLMQGAINFLEFTGPEAQQISIKQLGILTRDVLMNSVEYEPSPGVLDDLISSGNLSKLGSDQLRTQISLWQAWLKRVKKQEETINEYKIRIKDRIIEGGNPRKIFVANGIKKFTPGNFKNNSQAFLRDVRLENALSYFYVSSGSLDIYYYKNLKEINLQILESINQEIKEI